MLNEAILKFKGLAPLILPELVNNNQLEEVSMYEDYAILPYSVQKPLPLEEVMDMFEDKMEMIILYHMVPSEQTDFGHTCCAYSNPSTERMFKVNVTTNGSGEVDSLLVTEGFRYGTGDTHETVRGRRTEDLHVQDAYASVLSGTLWLCPDEEVAHHGVRHWQRSCSTRPQGS